MKVFCAGHESKLLRLRALVLESAGCVVQTGDPEEAVEAILTTDFNVVVVSFEVTDHDYDLIRRALAPQVRIVRLGKLTAPGDLIAAVREPMSTS